MITRMKKWLLFPAAALTLFCLAACNGVREAGKGGDGSREETDGGSEEKPSEEHGSEDGPASDGQRVLVAYFSATGTTRGVAEKIASSVGGTLYEITPALPYTSADLNYGDSNSRTTKEQNDPAARPAISGGVEDMAAYDVVFLGYPIWWGQAPKILYTFLESYDFSGKTVVPFCTSGSSGVGSSASNLHPSASGAAWLAGTRLQGGASQSMIDSYVNGLGIRLK